MGGERLVDHVVSLRKRIDIRATPEQVFDLLAHPEQAPRWQPGLVEATPGPGSEDGLVREGAGFEAVSEAFGGLLRWRAETTDVAPARRLAWHQVEGAWKRNDARFRLEPIPGGTRLHLEVDVEPPFALPTMRTFDEVDEELSRRYDDALLNLKDLLEAERGTEPA